MTKTDHYWSICLNNKLWQYWMLFLSLAKTYHSFASLNKVDPCWKKYDCEPISLNTAISQSQLQLSLTIFWRPNIWYWRSCIGLKSTVLVLLLICRLTYFFTSFIFVKSNSDEFETHLTILESLDVDDSDFFFCFFPHCVVLETQKCFVKSILTVIY